MKHPLYNTYHGMKQRCYYKKHKDYKYYGGKGIKVCDRWLESFDNFVEDMGEKPHPDLTLDRKDSNGDYEPSNCRWATHKEQAENRKPIEFAKTHKLRKTSSTGEKYITKHSDGFLVRKPINGKRVFLGLCKTIEEAIIVRNNGVKINKKESAYGRDDKGRYKAKNS